MNRYLVVDFENLEILSLNKVDMDFEENETYTSSISCIDEVDLVKTLQSDIIDDLLIMLDRKKRGVK